jgi:hypothetical protein
LRFLFHDPNDIQLGAGSELGQIIPAFIKERSASSRYKDPASNIYLAAVEGENKAYNDLNKSNYEQAATTSGVAP